MTEASSVIETRGLTKRFGGLTAVDQVDLTVPENEIRAIIGPNGAGKSTLFNMVTGFLDPSEGTVLFNGENITDLKPHERCQKGMSRSFQINEIFESLTVHENVRIAAQGKHEKRLDPLRDAASLESVNETVDEVLDRIGLADEAKVTARNLSYGDQRKLEIGLVLASDPTLLLFDEPTAGVGAEESHELEALIGEIANDRTVILIEHDIDMIMNIADKISVLYEGSLIAEGTPDEIASNQRVQDAYLGGEI
jgi:branched-chain amino acid transport system ATP-binding protein